MNLLGLMIFMVVGFIFLVVYPQGLLRGGSMLEPKVLRRRALFFYLLVVGVLSFSWFMGGNFFNNGIWLLIFGLLFFVRSVLVS